MPLIDETKRCELCGKARKLVTHHVMRGPWRTCSTGKRFANLMLCKHCHDTRIHGNELWPEARQLACLRRVRPDDLDLAAYNAMKGYGPNRITTEDLNKWE